MLCENIAALRKRKGLSQEELAARLNVVRQTVSKWEKGKSVPDAEMLLAIASELDCSVSTLLGESIREPDNQIRIEDMAVKLDEINLELARQSDVRRKKWRVISIIVCAVSVLILAGLIVECVYLEISERQLAGTVGIIGGADGPTAIFVSISSINVKLLVFALICLAAAVAGIIKTRRKRS